MGVGFLAGRKLLRFYAKLGQSKLLHFYGRDRIKLLHMPSFFSGALRAHTSITLQLTRDHSKHIFTSHSHHARHAASSLQDQVAGPHLDRSNQQDSVHNSFHSTEHKCRNVAQAGLPCPAAGHRQASTAYKMYPKSFVRLYTVMRRCKVASARQAAEGRFRAEGR